MKQSSSDLRGRLLVSVSVGQSRVAADIFIPVFTSQSLLFIRQATWKYCRLAGPITRPLRGHYTSNTRILQARVNHTDIVRGKFNEDRFCTSGKYALKLTIKLYNC